MRDLAGRVPDEELAASIGQSIKSAFSSKKKKDTNPGWAKIPEKKLIGNIGKQPGAQIKCTVSIDKAFKKSVELDDTDVSLNTKNDLSDLEFSNKLKLVYTEDFIDKNDILSRMTIDEFERLITYSKSSDSGMQLTNDITDTNNWESAKKERK